MQSIKRVIADRDKYANFQLVRVTCFNHGTALKGRKGGGGGGGVVRWSREGGGEGRVRRLFCFHEEPLIRF